MPSVLIVADRAGEKPVALPRGLALAERMGWAADVVAFCYESLGSIHDRSQRVEARQSLHDRRQAEVTAEIGRLRPTGVAVECTVAWEKDVHLWVDIRCARKPCAHLVYVIHVPHVLTELGLIDGAAHARKIAEDMHPVTEKLCDEHDIPRENLHIHEGVVEEVIVDEAERLQAQLVVMGTVGRHGVGAKVLGNLAERVLTGLRKDVLALKPGMAAP